MNLVGNKLEKLSQHFYTVLWNIYWRQTKYKQEKIALQIPKKILDKKDELYLVNYKVTE